MLLSVFRVLGHSMEPTIFQGHVVITSGIPYLFNTPTIGDIVVFRKEGKMLIKRIEKKNREKYFLTGDNKNDSLDSRKIGWVERKDIVGKVIL